MLKKSIIGLLLLAIAMPAFAGGDIEKKVQPSEWPMIYKWLTICDGIKVTMNIGYYVKIQQCYEKKIVLEQKSVHEYEGCTEIKMQSNFDMEIGCEIHPNANGLALAPKNKWSCWFEGDHRVYATTGWEKRNLCAKVKDAAILNYDPQKNLHVANVHILVRPLATP